MNPLRFAPLFAALVLLAGCASSTRLAQNPSPAGPLEYAVDLNDRSGDTFKVSVEVADLGPENAVYQFASTAPGTYQVMDMGRFVRSFVATSGDGTVIPSEQIATNQWRISDPEAVTRIDYEIAETWDNPVQENNIYMMCGTSIEEDHAQINGQAVFGYPTGMQDRPLRIRIQRPEAWVMGTALLADPTGALLADNYDHVVDSPILLGRLSTASVEVAGASIDVYTYSKTDLVHSDQILESVRDILEAAGRFLVELPVDRYAFLFHFEDMNMGAWEHSFSSTYTFAEADFAQAITTGIPSIVAHEFLHIVTPLNIHSEIIEQFNFVEPTPSEHVWLYEGTTEWMAQASQLRGGLIDLDTYLGRISGKLNGNDGFDADFSLSDISLQSYSPKGQREWGNIYQRGAVVAGLLDIMLLNESGGTRGLREVLLDLSSTYGPDRAFSEQDFFDEFAAMTYPGIRPFFERYVRDTQPLPIAETFALLGISYEPSVSTGEQAPQFGIQFGVQGDRLVVVGAADAAADCGLTPGDMMMEFNGTEVTLANAQAVFGEFQAAAVDVPFTFTMKRGDAEVDLTCAKRLAEVTRRHVFTMMPGASPEQVALRQAWVRNLAL